MEHTLFLFGYLKTLQGQACSSLCHCLELVLFFNEHLLNVSSSVINLLSAIPSFVVLMLNLLDYFAQNTKLLIFLLSAVPEAT